MKKTFSKLTLIAAIIFSLHACSTPEERATVVDGADTSTSTTSQSTDSLGSNAGGVDTMNSSDTSNNRDSSKTNKKMESFRHVPIDTITNKRDTTRQ